MNIFKKFSVILLVVAFIFSFTGLTPAHAGGPSTAPALGVAASFSVFANTAITNSAPSVISGDVGLNTAGTNYSGLTTGEVAGTIYDTNGTGPDGVPGNDPVLMGNVQAAISNANAFMLAEGAPTVIGTPLDALVLTSGVYDLGAGQLNGGVLTLDGPGAYIFRTSSSLTSSGSIVFINGARPCDVYWSVNTLATINGSSFAGTIIAGTGVHFGANVVLDGRALAMGGDVTMLSDTITGPSCVVPPPPPSGSGQVYVAPVYPLINVTKIPSPLNLPGGPGSVTYTYTVTNIGPNVIGDVTVKDDQCSSVNFIDGDDNGDSNLDLNESWKYECTKTVNATETNTVTACGTASNAVSTGVACDTASATVTVGIPVIPPLIHIIKKPNIFLLPAGGGAVTYSYTVTNPGTVPLHDVSVTDNKCTGLPGRVVGHPGDLNNNNLLESNESWSFTCLSNIFQTTTNIATAEGNANGFTVIDYAQATVAVAAPKLPNTGIAPSDVAIIIVGLLMLIGVFYYLARKKQTA